MAKKQFNQALEKLLRSAMQLNQKLTSQEHFWLMRSGFVGRQAHPEGGFILPTVSLLLVMLSLVLGILIFRTSNRTNQIIGERQQRQIFNATTPAIERAKAKLEFLFTEDTIPALPSEGDIVNALRNAANYDLPDETRVNLDGEGALDNAWTFWFDADGDPNTGPGPDAPAGEAAANPGKEVQVGYSILSYATAPDGSVALQDPDEDKAEKLVVRNGPINLSGGAGNPNCPNPGLAPFQGWQAVTGSALRKAIQVHAFARNPNTGVVTTLEMQQDKQANLGNKWGAWFRNDMEIFPGPDFRWNGAMNVAGSYVVGGDQVSFYPISSPFSCVYTPDNSEVVMGDIPQSVITETGNIDANTATGVGGNDLNGGTPFRGQFVIGTLRDNTFAGSSQLFPHTNALDNPGSTALTSANDSILDDGNGAPADPGEVALDPVLLLTQAQNRTRADSDNLAPDVQQAAWNREAGVNLQWWVEDERLHNEYQPTPFVDDTYRADDRWGPKPLYSEQPYIPAPADGSLNVSDPGTNEITVASSPGNNAAEQQSSFERLTRTAPPASNTTDEESYGLDGYWERRAKAQGVRVIVGQRLELGNANGWATEFDANGNGTFDSDEDVNRNGLLDFDPLYPAPANAADVGSASVSVGGTAIAPIDNNGAGSMEGRPHEQRQWKTLRDNAAAAQTASIYHYLMADGEYPLACIASTAHPGTEQTIIDSTTFNPQPGGGTNPDVNFLTGNGTNGWEFYPLGYSGTGAVNAVGLSNAATAFQRAVDGVGGDPTNGSLRIALDNLAHFAGDPAGAFPAFQDTQGANNADDAAALGAFREPGQENNTLGPVVHPYPIQSMWGDFSNLRRVMDKLNGRAAYGNTTYDQLSLADRTTLQTASCTLGMLAYNVNSILNNPDAIDTSGEEEELGNNNRDLVNAIRDLQTSTRVDRQPTSVTIRYTDYDDDDRDGNLTEELTFRAEITDGDIFNVNNPAASAVKSDVILKALRSEFNDDARYDLVKAVHDRHQIVRDRALGFSQGMVYDVGFGNFTVLGQNISESDEIRLQCDFVASNYFGLGKPNDASTEAEFLTLAMTLCPSSAKYPSLAYIFPDRNHAHDGQVADDTALDPLQVAARQQPQSEPYTSNSLEVNGVDFSNTYTFNRTGASSGNGSSWNTTNDIYKVVGDNDGNGILEAGEADFAAIALSPKQVGDWSQPIGTNNTGNVRINRITNNTGSGAAQIYPTFLDKGIFNGREAMVVRITDIDLDLMRRTVVTGLNTLGGTVNTDWWLPLPEILDPGEAPTRTGAAIYAFREDTVREDGIARPRAISPNRGDWGDAWLDYVNNTIDNDYLMDAVGDNPQDPPVNPINGISPKAVDFYPDPDRRPHGFRLRNGANLTRVTSGGRNAEDADERGMSFVSDNPVYVMGDFNLHSTNGTTGNLLQEFETALADDWGNFFTRQDLELRFAQGDTDTWRASEVVGDSVTLLSDLFDDNDTNAFHDGWISQGILNNDGSGERSGFRTLNRPVTSDLTWVREDGSVSLRGNIGDAVDYPIPIKISLRGFPVYCSNPLLSDSADSGALNGLATGLSCVQLGGEEREYGLRDNADDRSYLSFEVGERNDEARKPLIDTPPNTYMNLLMVSGTTPSRARQSNGGLHNFPRFLENFRNQNMWISGSIYQLAFSNSATGAFDQDSWEPDSLGVPREDIRYYEPPNRRWGYDTALQLVQPAPIAQRFATPSNIRSEFFRELAVDDPYIVNLRCAVGDPTVDQTACP